MTKVGFTSGIQAYLSKLCLHILVYLVSAKPTHVLLGHWTLYHLFTTYVLASLAQERDKWMKNERHWSFLLSCVCMTWWATICSVVSISKLEKKCISQFNCFCFLNFFLQSFLHLDFYPATLGSVSKPMCVGLDIKYDIYQYAHLRCQLSKNFVWFINSLFFKWMNQSYVQ